MEKYEVLRRFSEKRKEKVKVLDYEQEKEITIKVDINKMQVIAFNGSDLSEGKTRLAEIIKAEDEVKWKREKPWCTTFPIRSFYSCASGGPVIFWWMT